MQSHSKYHAITNNSCYIDTPYEGSKCDLYIDDKSGYEAGGCQASISVTCELLPFSSCFFSLFLLRMQSDQTLENLKPTSDSKLIVGLKIKLKHSKVTSMDWSKWVQPTHSWTVVAFERCSTNCTHPSYPQQ